MRDICAILLGEEIGENPEISRSRQDDGSMFVVVEALLENAAANIVGLAERDLLDRLA
jgi:hypothetical protein